MVYLSAKHIGIKKDQDRTAYDTNKIVICDGIGEFNDSAKAAEITIDNILLAEQKQGIIGMINRSAKNILSNSIDGGTTLISATIDSIEETLMLRIAYIGNGSVFHLHGNYHEIHASHDSSSKPYRFSNILIPHIDKEGVLLRHISHHSNEAELIPSFIDLSLTGINGDIVLLFSDGISSLEDDIIVTDDQQRMWRYQSENVSIVLSDLHEWLKSKSSEINQKVMDDFLDSTLMKLKNDKKLEDDASIGLIISDSVLNYYKEFYHVA